MSVLILKNIISEGPGTIEEFLRDKGRPYSVVELGEGETPPPLDGFETLVVMGGPMAIYEAEKYGFLKEGFKAIEEALKREMSVLGICLGAQAVAHVLGAKVYKGHTQEMGWLDVELTYAGLEDRVVSTLSDGGGGRIKVFHWHGDTFNLPGGARRLARSKDYENQAFGYGKKVYGLQFHIEVTPEMVSRWFRGEAEEARM
ncbi:MAG: hypothetical protein GTN65_17830, partial [Armatimonadetes bacterium]|nr:hypothetical protein [Armatimonadota bacterium]NIO98901.1 hypothetical protein [Armatimonadota bacterium]NIT31540.1 hypothetical protein [Armatimonadota bacterium]